MTPFKAPIDDILFSLTHVAKAQMLPDWDRDLTSEIAAHFAQFAEGELAPINAIGDAQGCELTNGRVRMPDGFVAAYQAYVDQGWPSLTGPEAFGGQGLDALTAAVVSELFAGANHSLQMITGLVPGAIGTVMRYGSEAQKQRHLPGLISGDTLATMCLTEPGAGSDLSQIRCRATENPSGQGDWQIKGEKIFISGGDQDLSPHILHLVLARTSDDGVKGLSLFLCASETADGDRNPITVTRLEEKMGLHGSPTCQMQFDGAQATLIGTQGQGLAAMFTMMDHARLDVSLQGVAHAARAFDIAKTYAAERQQGRDANRQSVMLDQHADVARMLREIDALAVGSRAMAHVALVALERGENRDLLSFLTPLCKVQCTEAGIAAAELGIQVLGGYGYLTEYQLDQTYRDARITSIYEGANGIHARMLVSRLLFAAPGEAFADFIEDNLGRSSGRGAEADHPVALWHAARELLRDCQDVSGAAHAFMKLSQEVMLLCLWQRIKAAAPEHPDPARIAGLAKSQALKSQVSAKSWFEHVKLQLV